MQTVTNQNLTPLSLETRRALPTDARAHHLNPQSQTLRAWGCLGNDFFRLGGINGCLAWSMADIKRLLTGGE